MPRTFTSPTLQIGLGLSMLLASLGTSIVNIAQPSLMIAFHQPFDAIQHVILAYLFCMTLFTLLAGKLGDRYGRQRVQLMGLVLFAIASGLCSFATTLPQLVFARGLQGLAAAILVTLTMAILRDHTDPAHTGKAMGWLGTLSALGTALGPSLGGWLIEWQGWPGIFRFQPPFALLAILLLVIGLARSSHTPPANPAAAPANTKAAIQPLLPALLSNATVAMVMMTTLIVGPFYLSLSLGLSAHSVGMVMAVGPLLSILSGVPAGKLTDQFGSQRIIRIGQGLLIAGSLLLATLPLLIGLYGYLIAITILTPGYQLFQAANNTQLLANTAAAQRGTLSAYLTLSRNLGLILGSALIGKLFTFAAGTTALIHASPDAIAKGMMVTFLVCSGMLVGVRKRFKE